MFPRYACDVGIEESEEGSPEGSELDFAVPALVAGAIILKCAEGQ
jgi:hypothetical protein